MIATILAFFYITFICRAYGLMLFCLFAKVTGYHASFHQPFIITCFSGLAIIAVLSTALSLLAPIDNVVVHLVLLSPALFWSCRNRTLAFSTSTTIWSKLQQYPISIIALLTTSILLVLIMHAWFINHPDTLTYHAQNIQWIEKHRAIPGLANLHTNYGIQSSWFVVCAIFSFAFTGTAALTFINATALAWFIIFVTQKINLYLQKEAKENILMGFLWLALLMISFSSYTQVRLTATSASPDFIVALYSWLIIYLFFASRTKQGAPFNLLLIFLGFFAVTIKLSALPLLLFTVYSYYKYNGNRSFLQKVLPVGAGLAILSPLLVRNVISSGYLIFPVSFPDIFPADWKVPKAVLTVTRQYITAYARANVEYSGEEIKAVLKMSPSDWLPHWWSLRSLMDKIIVASVPVMSMVLILFKRKSFRNQDKFKLAGLFFLLAGILFWFITAPDPRFGFGFLLPMSGLLIYMTIGNIKINLSTTRRWLGYSLILCSIVLATYSIYRLTNYFTPKNIFSPSGVINAPYQTIDCGGLLIKVPLRSSNCGSIPLPCAKDSCTTFVPRGKSIQDGFRSSR